MIKYAYFLLVLICCGKCSKGQIQLEDEEDFVEGKNLCTRHPDYWCADLETAESCGENAVQYCKDHNLGAFRDLIELEEDNELEGDMECTRGPRFWCSSIEVAKKCGKLDYCQQRGMIGEEEL